MWSTDGRSSPVCDGLLISVEWLKSTLSRPSRGQARQRGWNMARSASESAAGGRLRDARRNRRVYPMVGLRKGIGWMTLLTIGILGLIVIVKPSEAFKGCVHANKNSAQYQKLHEGDSSFAAKIVRFYFRSRLIGICVTNFVDHNERAIGAFSAAALALFTLYLWRTTQGLRRYAGIQTGDMQKLLTVARDNAAAAASQAEAMGKLHAVSETQERVMRDQAKAMADIANAAARSADIARRVLVELERPFIVVEVVDLGEFVNDLGRFDFSQPSAHWQVANYGRSPATLVDRILRWTTETGQLPHAIDPSIATGSSFPDGCVVIEGKPLRENHNLYLELDKFQDVYGTDAINGKYQVWCCGYVRYKDTVGGIYVNGFCLVFDAVGKRFVRMGPPSHNYTHVEKEPGT
jgi:hypothetical protein